MSYGQSGFDNNNAVPVPQPVPPPQYPPQQFSPPVLPAAGYPAAQFGPGYPGSVPPQQQSKAPLITMVVLGVALLLGVGTVLIAVGGDPEESTIVSQDESDEKSSQDSTGTGDQEPTEAEPTSEEAGATLPEEMPDESEFKGWEDQLGATELVATKTDGWNYDECADVENAGALTDLGCIEAVEIDYKAEGGDMQLTTILLGMPDSSTATDVGMEGVISDKDVTANFASPIKNPAATGLKTSGEGNIVVVTMYAAKDGVDEKLAEDYLENLHWDIAMGLYL